MSVLTTSGGSELYRITFSDCDDFESFQVRARFFRIKRLRGESFGDLESLQSHDDNPKAARMQDMLSMNNGHGNFD